jgi:Xaa-Pro aminopeptidase
MTISDKLFSLRSIMAANSLEAYIISSNDQHLSEYIAEYWKFREWISNFTGSSGTLVVLEDDAALWTDSRYYLQAEKELENTGIQLFKSSEPGVPKPEEWIVSILDSGTAVGLDGRTFSIDDIRQYAKIFRQANLRLDPNQFLADEIWTTRPLLPDYPIYEYPTELAGATRAQKLQQVRRHMLKNNTTHYITSSLDEIAWVLNLRGNDIPYNPVFHAFLIITDESVHLFTNPHKVTSTLGKKLAQDEVKISLYDDFYKTLKEIPQKGSNICFDPSRTNGSLLSALPQTVQKTECLSLISIPKACKTDAEIKGIETAMIKDGIAMVKWLRWMDENVSSKKLTEVSVAAKAKEFRAEQEDFKSLSFKTIAGYKSNGAIVHYAPTEENCAEIKKSGLLLFDSGAQYLQGTTDLTRTISLGNIQPDEISDYTLVLKGHIALATAIFPEGTRGCQLDILARYPLWQQTLNYGHGTGHGVGCFLNVHEGPHGIRPQDNGIALQPGMITSNEPGLYREDKYGIRLENLLLIEPYQTSDFGNFLHFRTLTLCPFDLKPIKKEMLTEAEIKWLNDYHQMVYNKLAPHLDEETKQWLITQTQNI